MHDEYYAKKIFFKKNIAELLKVLIHLEQKIILSIMNHFLISWGYYHSHFLIILQN